MSDQERPTPPSPAPAPRALARTVRHLPGRLLPPLVAAVRSLSRRVSALPRWQLPGGLRPWITLGSLGFVLAALFQHGRQLVAFRLDLQGLLWLGLGVGVSLLSLVVNGFAWGVLMRWLGFQPRWPETISLFVDTNLRKFLPGGIWHLSGRVQALRSEDGPLAAPIATAPALAAVLLEPLLAALAALALVTLGGWQSGVGVLTLLPLMLLQPRWLGPLLERLELRKARDLGLSEELRGERDQTLTPAGALIGVPWQPLLAEFGFVLLRFAGFACCVWAFDLQQSIDWLTWLAGFALAWTAGLVVPGAPGGLGVFEAVLLLRLGGALPEASLLAVALSYRLMVTLADLLAALLVRADAWWADRGFGGSSSQ